MVYLSVYFSIDTDRDIDIFCGEKMKKGTQMRKIIKKIGNSLGLIFNKEECKANNIKKNDFIDLKFMKVKK